VRNIIQNKVANQHTVSLTKLIYNGATLRVGGGVLRLRSTIKCSSYVEREMSPR